VEWWNFLFCQREDGNRHESWVRVYYVINSINVTIKRPIQIPCPRTLIPLSCASSPRNPPPKPPLDHLNPLKPHITTPRMLPQTVLPLTPLRQMINVWQLAALARVKARKQSQHPTSSIQNPGSRVRVFPECQRK